MAGITVKIGGVDKTEYVDARTLRIRDELTSKVNSASFDFICNDIAVAPAPGEIVLIEEGTKKLFSGRILSKKESFLPPNLLKYPVECIDHTRDLDKKLVVESYKDQRAGDIIKNLIAKYTITSISWMSPTGHLDEHNKWEFEHYAYDDNDASYTFTPVPPTSWGVDFLDLLIDEVICNKVRFKARFSQDGITAISLYVYYESAWHKIYQGGYNTWSVWNEISLNGFYSVSRAAAVFYNSSDIEENAHLHEFDFGVAEPDFTTNNVDDGPIISDISFDNIQVSEAITRIAEICGYEWYVDYDKDIHFFAKKSYPAPFQLDDNQADYKDLIINTNISQLRNRVFVKSSELKDTFGEVFIYDGLTTHWTCKFAPINRGREKLPNPDPEPTRGVWRCGFSHNDIYLAVPYEHVVFANKGIYIFKREKDSFKQLNFPDVTPNNDGHEASFSPDSTYLALAHNGTPYVMIYKRDEDTFTKLDDPNIKPTGVGWGCDFSPDGVYLAVAHNDSPYITIYKRSGDTFAKLNPVGGFPAGDSYGCKFSPDGVYLAVAHKITPFITIYKRDGDTFTKLDNPASSPTGWGLNVAWTPDSIYLAVGHDVTPFVTAYKRADDVFTKIADPADTPTGPAYGIDFSPDGIQLAVAHHTTPFVTIYTRSGDILGKQVDPADLPGGDGKGAVFSHNGKYLVIGHWQAKPYIIIYRQYLPTMKVDGVIKTIGWDEVDDPAHYDFMLNEKTKVLSIGAAGILTIDIGTEEGHEAVVGNPHFTHINKINPANETGKITQIAIRAKRNLINCEVATFYRPDPTGFPNKLSTRDTENIGTVISGSKQIFDVDLDVVEGDYIGIHFTDGAIYATHETEVGVWWASGDKIPCTNQTFGEDETFMISLYGTGRITGEGELAIGSELMVGYSTTGVSICFKREDKDSIDIVKALEGGDGIFEFCLVDNNIDSIAWANEVAKADLLQNADPNIKATFITNRGDIRSGQIITLNSTKRNINQQFIVQSVDLVRVDVITEWPTIPYKPAAEAKIGYKLASEAEKPYRAAGDSGGIIYYIFNVTIANKFKKLEDLFIYLLNRTDESLK